MSSTVMSRCTCWGCPSGHSGRTWSGASCTSMTCSPSTEIVCQSSSTSTVPPSRPAQKALTSSMFAASRAGIMLVTRMTATLGEDPDGPVPGWRGGVGVRRGASGGGAHALGLAAGLELGGLLRLGGGEGADRAGREDVPLGGAVLAAEVDDLQVAPVPGGPRERLLEVGLDLLHGRAAREAPAACEPEDVGVHRERGHVERLRHHDARGLVADAGEALEELPVRHQLTTGLDDLARRRPDVAGLRRREPDLADQLEDALGPECVHLRGRRGLG